MGAAVAPNPVVTAPITSGLVAYPYDPARMDPVWSSKILDEVVQHPAFFSTPTTPQERRNLAAGVLADAGNRFWGVWDGGNLAGILSLTKVLTGVDATFHFLFFDHNLVGRRALLHRFLTHCFTVDQFRRVSAEVPADADKLLRFYRKELRFRYEGEDVAGRNGFPYASAGPSGQKSLTATTIAKYGSRVQGVFWRSDQWIDVFRLRLLRDEWQEEERRAHLRQQTHHDRAGPSRPESVAERPDRALAVSPRAPGE